MNRADGLARPGGRVLWVCAGFALGTPYTVVREFLPMNPQPNDERQLLLTGDNGEYLILPVSQLKRF